MSWKWLSTATTTNGPVVGWRGVSTRSVTPWSPGVGAAGGRPPRAPGPAAAKGRKRHPRERDPDERPPSRHASIIRRSERKGARTPSCNGFPTRHTKTDRGAFGPAHAFPIRERFLL